MKLIAVIISAMLATYSVAVAQGNPSGRGSTTGDPAASTSNPRAQPGGTVGASSANPGGSGTSTSGGKDDNGEVPHLMTIGKWYDPISQRWIVPRGVF